MDLLYFFLQGRASGTSRARSNQYDAVRERTLKSLIGLLERKGACKKLWLMMNQPRSKKSTHESKPNEHSLMMHQMCDSTNPIWRKG